LPDAELELEGQTIRPSWLVPSGAEHRYKIVEALSAIEATAPLSCAAAREFAQPRHVRRQPGSTSRALPDGIRQAARRNGI
jgi:hypothetical protein